MSDSLQCCGNCRSYRSFRLKDFPEKRSPEPGCPYQHSLLQVMCVAKYTLAPLPFEKCESWADKKSNMDTKEKRIDDKEYIYIDDVNVWQCCFCGAYDHEVETVKHFDNCKEEHYDYNEED